MHRIGQRDENLLLLLRERILHEGEKVVNLKLLPLPLLLPLAASEVSFTRPKREKLCGKTRTDAVVLPTANVLGAAIASLTPLLTSPRRSKPSQNPRNPFTLTSTHDTPVPRNVNVSAIANTHNYPLRQYEMAIVIQTYIYYNAEAKLSLRPNPTPEFRNQAHTLRCDDD